MLLETNMFGTIETDGVKKLLFEDGIIGFPDMKNFTLITDAEDAGANKIYWLQSLDDGTFAMPIVNPFDILDEYNPIVEDEWFAPLGEHTEEDLLVFLALTVPAEVEKMSLNQKAPIIINSRTQKGCQIIVEDESCEIQFPIYDILKAKKESR